METNEGNLNLFNFPSLLLTSLLVPYLVGGYCIINSTWSPPGQILAPQHALAHVPERFSLWMARAPLTNHVLEFPRREACPGGLANEALLSRRSNRTPYSTYQTQPAGAPHSCHRVVAQPELMTNKRRGLWSWRSAGKPASVTMVFSMMAPCQEPQPLSGGVL